MYLIDVFSLSLGVGSIVVKNATASGGRANVLPLLLTLVLIPTYVLLLIVWYYCIILLSLPVSAQSRAATTISCP